MLKHSDDFFDETYYTHTLANGLKVIVFHKPDFKTTACALGTPYGALHIHEKKGDEVFDFHPGIAHFLEHKLFESDDNLFERFSAMACNVNAFTSYRETVYYFQTTSRDIRDPLQLLLDFVQDLKISEASVEKEKGIIIQELSMYLQNSDSCLLNEGYKSLYHHYPLKYDIGGDEETVSAITKEELELCYKLNYHPSKMALVIVSPLDPDYLLQIVEENQNNKSFEGFDDVILNDKKEPLEIVRPYYEFKMDINKEKSLYAIKLLADFKDPNDAFIKQMCFDFYLKAYFSASNPSYQTWLDQGLINDFFGADVDFDLNSAYLLFYAEGIDPRKLKDLVDEALMVDDLLDEELLMQIKRSYLGNAFDVFDDIGAFANNFIRDHLEGLDFFDNYKRIMNVSLADVKAIIKGHSYDNYVFVHISPSGK